MAAIAGKTGAVSGSREIDLLYRAREKAEQDIRVLRDNCLHEEWVAGGFPASEFIPFEGGSEEIDNAQCAECDEGLGLAMTVSQWNEYVNIIWRQYMIALGARHIKDWDGQKIVIESSGVGRLTKRQFLPTITGSAVSEKQKGFYLAWINIDKS
jgi:hypothetical protein